MTKEEMQKYESGFNEGLMYGVQLTVSEILRIINNHNWLLKPDKIKAEAHFRMAARRILQRRGLVPFEHDIMTGKAEPVELNFNMKMK
jgi:hypothetical protein